MGTMGKPMTPEEDFLANYEEYFHDGNGKGSTVASRADDVMPQLPDGIDPDGMIGLDYDSIRAMLALKNNASVGLDDPIMMMVTICNAFLGQQEKINKRHNEALTKIMTDQCGKYIAQFKTVTDGLGKALAENSVDAVREIFNLK